MKQKTSSRFLLALTALIITTATLTNSFSQIVPKTWDGEAIASLEVPLAHAAASPIHVTADYYYRIPVRPLYKTYPVYHPSKEPPGYFKRLKRLEPQTVPFDSSKFKTKADWIKAGRLIFDEPTDFDISGTPEQYRDPSYYT